MQGRDEVYSEKIRAGKRTYFFDVRSTRSNDYYITITESKRRFNGKGYDKHKIFLYKEDFNKFLAALNKTIDHVKTELLPDYDYEEFDRDPEYRDNYTEEGGIEESSEKSKEFSAEETLEETEVPISAEVDLDSEDLSASWED